MIPIQNKILQEIKNKKISPKPKWFFSARKTLLWSSIIFSLAIGSVAVALITFALTDADWDISRQMHKSFFEYLLMIIPYIWIFGLFIFAFIAYFEFRKTTNGYRYMPYFIIFGGIFISILVGETLYVFGFGEKLHELFEEKIPYYDHVVLRKRDVWSRPDDGMVSGKVQLIPATTTFLLVNWDKTSWRVFVHASTTILGKTKLENGEVVKIIGERITTSTFSASEIRPWQRPPGFRRPPLERRLFPCEINSACPRINR